MLNSILLFKSSLTKGNNLVGVGGGDVLNTCLSVLCSDLTSRDSCCDSGLLQLSGQFDS